MTRQGVLIHLSWLDLTIILPAGRGFAPMHIIGIELGENGGISQLRIIENGKMKIIAIKSRLKEG
jgi:hypothetical protein